MEIHDPVPEYDCRAVRPGFAVDGDLFKYPWTEVAPVWFLPATLKAEAYLETVRSKLHDPAYFNTGFSRGSDCNVASVDFQLTAFGACWTESHLYLAYRCMDSDVWSTYTQRDEPLYEQEVVEAFLCPTGDPRHYFEDADVIVINKARGMVVHPAPGSETGTLVHAVLGYADDLSGIGGELRPGIVHRLDKDTSGLMVVAKTDAAHLSLQAQIQAKTAERRYQAILWGQPKFEQAVVEAPIGRNPGDRKKMAVITDPRQPARDAVTELTVLERLGPFCFVEAKLQTGRTHQIRVHCQYIGHPVVGDPLYGGLRKVPAQGVSQRDRQEIEHAIEALNGQALHAYSLSFDHPRTGEQLKFETEAPAVIAELLGTIRRACSPSARPE